MTTRTFWIRYLALFITLALFISMCAHAVEPDKRKHVVASAVLSVALSKLDQRKAFKLCMAVGLAKELTDKHVSGKDLLADAVGCAVGRYGVQFVRDVIKLQFSVKF